jgi:CubicO group peptidase (beta-lactamase class C family)
MESIFSRIFGGLLKARHLYFFSRANSGGYSEMMTKILSRILVVLLMLSAIGTIFAEDKTERVDKIFAFWDKPESPGCALAIVKDGEIIYKRGYGMANLENNVPITPQSVFYIGSVSKQFVAMCVALLVQEEKVFLDDDVQKYIPELPNYGNPITIRHLIHHMSGIRDYLTLEDIAGIPFGFYHDEDVLKLIVRQKELNFQPGEEYLYSNSGYFLLSVIIHRASGKTLRQYAQEKIFNPLGMKNSRFHDNYEELIKNRASGYLSVGGGKFKNFISTFDCVGSGGLFTSVEDLYLWDQNFYHHKVGGKEVFNLMHTVGALNNGIKLDYAFALDIKTYKGLKTVSHGGALGGYKSALIRFPEHNFSVICLSNLSSFNPTMLSYRVANVYLSDFFKDEKEKPAEIQTIHLPIENLKSKVGSYIRFESGEKIRVNLKEGKLYIALRNREYPLAPISEFEYIVQNISLKLSIRFERPKSDSPLLLHVQEVGKRPRTYVASDVEAPNKNQLSEYQGRFYSEELHVTFKIKQVDGKLRFVHRKASQTPFKPLYLDFFQVGSLRVRFVRNEEKEITSFLLDAGRVKNLRFTKVNKNT